MEERELKDFSIAFQITRLVVFEVRYSHIGDNKEADFATSAEMFTKNKKTYSNAGQCQERVLSEGTPARDFYDKWDAKHLQKLTPEEYDELMSDLQVLKNEYNYIERNDNRDIPFYDVLELSKQPLKSKKVEESEVSEEFSVSDLKKKAQEILPSEDIDVHDGDLYIKVSPKSTELINRMKDKDSGLLTTFKSQIDNQMWYEIPFGNMQDDATEKLQEDEGVDKSMDKEEILRNAIYDLCENDEDIMYRETDDAADDFLNVLDMEGDLADIGYDINRDREELETIATQEVNLYKEQHIDIYQLAEEYDGNLAKDPLEDNEWEQIYENAPEVFKEALGARAAFVKDWWGEIPDIVWDVLEQSVDDQIGFTNYNPASIIDNVLVNGSYGDFDNYKMEDETDEEFVEREEGNCMYIFPEERFIIYSL